VGAFNNIDNVVKVMRGKALQGRYLSAMGEAHLKNKMHTGSHERTAYFKSVIFKTLKKLLF
jgi:hypothetical protein